MASQEGMSKAAKKNMKRKAKKQKENVTTRTSDEPDLEELYDKAGVALEEAKKEKDFTKIAKYRQQRWVLSDLMSGVKTNMPEEELREVMRELLPKKTASSSSETKVKVVPVSARVSPSPKKDTSTDKPSESVGDSQRDSAASAEPEKRLRNLRKKLSQIETLREKQAKGVVLEESQVAKIASASQVQEEIRQLEHRLKEL